MIYDVFAWHKSITIDYETTKVQNSFYANKEKERTSQHTLILIQKTL